MPFIQVFKTGTHVAMSGAQLVVNPNMLRELADSYDPTVHEAPLVVGHPSTDDPAYGWVKGVRVNGDVLEVEPHKVDPSFAELVKAGRYNKISVSLYPPDMPGNPRPGKWALKHVGFLGATPPAVKGLKPVALSDGGMEFCFAAHQEVSVDPKELEAMKQRLAELEGREAALKAAEDKVKADALAAKQARAAQFCEGLVTKGQLLPVDRAGVEKVLVALDVAAPISFGDKKDVAPATVLEDFLKRLPSSVPLGELVKDEASGGVSFASPPGCVVDEERLKLHQRAVDYMTKNKVDYNTAIRLVS